MASLKRRVAVVVVVGLVSYAGSAVWRSRTGERRFSEARARIYEECKTYRSAPMHTNADVCRAYDAFGPKPFPSVKRADALFADAHASLGRGDPRAAEASIGKALAETDALERQGTMIATLVSARIVKQALAIFAAHPELDASLLRRVRLDAHAALQAERLQTEWSLLQGGESPPGGWMATQSAADVADRVEATEASYHAMDVALSAGDVPSCEAAAGNESNGIGRIPRETCSKLAGLSRVATR